MLPALPAPSAITPAQMAEYGQQIVAWAEKVEDLTEVREAAHKWAAITEYVRRTSKVGVAEAEATLRRLEVRVGELLPKEQGRRSDLELDHRDDQVPKLHDQTKRHLREMAEHADVVEDVIAGSNDSSPPSRRKVVAAIKEQGAARRPALPKSADNAAGRLRKATESLERIFKDDRFTANRQQIADKARGHLTYTLDTCRTLLARLDEQDAA